MVMECALLVLQASEAVAPSVAGGFFSEGRSVDAPFERSVAPLSSIFLFLISAPKAHARSTAVRRGRMLGFNTPAPAFADIGTIFNLPHEKVVLPVRCYHFAIVTAL